MAERRAGEGIGGGGGELRYVRWIVNRDRASETTVGRHLEFEVSLSVDMELVAKLATWPRRGRPGSRTTIQQLVAATQASGRTVASLTRWSAV